MLANVLAAQALVDGEAAEQRGGDERVTGQLAGNALGPGGDIDAQRQKGVVAENCVAVVFANDEGGSDPLARVLGLDEACDAFLRLAKSRCTVLGGAARSRRRDGALRRFAYVYDAPHLSLQAR